MAQDAQISRRSIARAAAWSVPAIAIAAAVPAHAASGSALANVVGICAGRSPSETFTVTIANIPLGETVQISLAKSTIFGSFTADLPGYTHTGAGTASNPYVFVIDGTGTPFQGTIEVTVSIDHLPGNPPMTITTTVAGVDGFTPTGITSASVTKHRDGNSSNYPCG